MMTSRRAVLLGTASVFALSSKAADAFFPGAFIAVGGGTGQLAALTLVNTSGSLQAAGAVTPMFGWPFKKGDIASGAAPKFQVAGVNQPYSWGGQTYWSDGSLKFATFMLRTTASIAGSGTLSISIFGGGTAPTTSARALADIPGWSVPASAISVNATFAPVTGCGGTPSATVSSWLTNDANMKGTAVYLDGDAGKVWRIDTDMAASQGGAAHGQLVCYHYIAALTDSGGNLGGFRYLPRICQPWFNVDSPTKAGRAFSSLGWKIGSGSTTNFPLGITSKTVTSNGSTTCTITGSPAQNPFWYGSGYSPAGAVGIQGCTPWNVTGCYLTAGTTSVPSPLDTTSIWFARVNSGGLSAAPTASAVLICQCADGAAEQTVASSGGNNFTINPVHVCTHFGNLFGYANASVAGVNVPMWNFFQGSGSLTADGTVRVQFDKTYWRSTKLLPPLDLTATISDYSFPFDWGTPSIGPVTGLQDDFGERWDIGPITDWNVRDFFNQSVTSEKVTRMVGIAAAHEAITFKDSVSRQIVNLRDSTTSTYTGIPNANISGTNTSTAVCWNPAANGTTTGAWTPPPSTGSLHFIASPFSFTFQGSANFYTHRANFGYYAYMRIGQPELLDLLIEMGNTEILNKTVGVSGRNPTLPAPVAGNGIMNWYSGFEFRGTCWALRGIVNTATLCPQTTPDGAQLGKYFTDLAAANMAYHAYLVSNNLPNSYWGTNGLWSPTDLQTPNKVASQYSAWQIGYGEAAFCFAAGGLESADALTVLNQISKFHNHIYTIGGNNGWHLTNYQARAAIGDIGGEFTDPISSDAQYGTLSNFGGTLAWQTTNYGGTSPGCKFSIASKTLPATLSSNDQVIWNVTSDPAIGSSGVPVNFTADTVTYYTRDVQTILGTIYFNLASSPGGVAISPGDNTSAASEPFWLLTAPPAANLGSTSGAYTWEVLNCCRWETALGVATNLAGVITDLTGRTTANNWPVSNGATPADFAVAYGPWVYQSSF